MPEWGEAPLAGVRVLAVSQYGAGPFGILYLADLGAEVIKVEDPGVGGDVARYIPPFAEAQDSLMFQALNRNQQSVTLNLRSEAGRALFRRLAAEVDVVYNNLRGDQPEKLGLTYEQLKEVNPRVVCTSLSGFGLTGPRRADPGYDYLIQGLMGLISLTGEPDGPPARAGLSVIDFVGGLTAALGTVSAVVRARRTGIGGDVDVSLLDSGLALLNYLTPWALNGGFEPTRLPDSAHPSVVPSQVFPTADGHIVVMCQKEKFWTRLCEQMDRTDLLADSRFARMADRYQHREELIPILKAEFRRQTTGAWIEKLTGKVPCAPVNTVRQALAEPHVAAREMILGLSHPRWGEVQVMNCPIKVTGWRTPAKRAPDLGADRASVLQGVLSLTEAEIAELDRAGAFGSREKAISEE